MKFSQLINESKKVDNIIYHVSIKKISSLNSNPMWFDIRQQKANAYYQNFLNDKKPAFLYSAKLNSTNIWSFKKLKEELNKNKINVQDFVADLVSNPSAIKIKQLTKDLNCDGFYHSDYDPEDFSKDIETLLILNPKKSVNGFKLIEKEQKIQLNYSLEKSFELILYNDKQNLTNQDIVKIKTFNLMDDESYDIQLKKFIKSNWKLEIDNKELNKRIKVALKTYGLK